MIRTALLVAFVVVPLAYASHRYTSHVDAVTACVMKTRLPIHQALDACAEK